LSAPISKPAPALRALIILVCAIVFLALIAYSAHRVRYNFGDKSNTEFTATQLSLSHNLIRADDGSLQQKDGDVTNTGARRPCPT